MENQRRLRPEDILRTLLVTAVVIVIGFVVGNFTFNELNGRGTPYYVLAAGIGILVTALAYTKFEVVLLAYVAITWLAIGGTPDVVTGVSSHTGKAVSLSLIGITFLLVMWIIRGLTGRGFSFIRTPANRLLFLYLAFNVLTAVNGRLFWDPKLAHFYEGAGDPRGGRTQPIVNMFEVFIRFLSAGAFWLFASNLRTEAWLRRASWLLLLPGALTFLAYILRLPLPLSGYSLLPELVTACTLFAWLIEPRIPGTPERRGLRFWGWVLLGLVVFQVFYLGLRWVSGYVGLFVGLYVVAYLHSKRLFARMLFAGLCFFLTVHVLIQQVVSKVANSGDKDRFSMVHAAFLYALHFPLGIGPGNYRAYNTFYGAPDQWGTTRYTSAHDFYAQMLSEMGFGGLLITALFVFTALIMLARFYRALPLGRSRTFVLGIAGMWGGICAATAIGDYLIPVYHNNAIGTYGTTVYAWVGLGIGCAYARFYGLLPEKKPEAVTPAVPNAVEYYPRRMSRESIRE